VSFYALTGAISGLGYRPASVPRSGFGEGIYTSAVGTYTDDIDYGMGEAQVTRPRRAHYMPGSADDPTVCDQGAGWVIRMIGVARQAAHPRFTALADQIADRYTMLEARRQRGEGVCLQMAALGRNAEALARAIAAQPSF